MLGAGQGVLPVVLAIVIPEFGCVIPTMEPMIVPGSPGGDETGLARERFLIVPGYASFIPGSGEKIPGSAAHGNSGVRL
jgi:hypothetical protein